MPETTFTFRVDDSLKAAFSDAAKQKDRLHPTMQPV